jgi:hypothetical protein
MLSFLTLSAKSRQRDSSLSTSTNTWWTFFITCALRVYSLRGALVLMLPRPDI